MHWFCDEGGMLYYHPPLITKEQKCGGERASAKLNNRHRGERIHMIEKDQGRLIEMLRQLHCWRMLYIQRGRPCDGGEMKWVRTASSLYLYTYRIRQGFGLLFRHAGLIHFHMGKVKGRAARSSRYIWSRGMPSWWTTVVNGLWFWISPNMDIYVTPGLRVLPIESDIELLKLLDIAWLPLTIEGVKRKTGATA